MLFILSLYNNKVNPEINSTIEWVTYGSSIGCAFVWSILNYVDHIKISALYKTSNDIDAYVSSLAMKREEKEDLKVYLNDFVTDLEANGKTKEEAIKAAISQFQVQEFTSLSKNGGILELPTHYYLLGYAVAFIVLNLIIQIFLGTGIINSFWLHAISFTSILYAVSFFGLIFLYKLIDILVTKNLK
jgi:hypothetical protein